MARGGRPGYEPGVLGSYAAAWLLAAMLPTGDTAAPWCAEELETLEADVCYEPGTPAKDGKRTLVVFLHGLVDEGSGWQHNQQRGMARAAKKWGFAMIAPRGRPGLGPKRRADQIGWPTAESARESVEGEVLAEWQAARKSLEARSEAPFDRVWVMGFSNGAYYASSLALRGKLDVDGYAVFAGGSAFPGAERLARATKSRRPVFVGVAAKDSTGKDGASLVKLLKRLGWPHKGSTRNVGHTVADAHLEAAIEFLAGEPVKKDKKDKKNEKGRKDKKAKR